jgi:flavin reductase (DIM6/NTAB) family NADH-FMN oxidoreductase RutF
VVGREAFDGFVAALAGALVVVTVACDDERAGCLVGFHCQCSIDPPRYAVWLSKANHTYRVALHAELLAVHLLTADDHDVAARFGGETGDAVDKFAGCAWTPGPGGVPLLDRLPRRVVGRKHTVLDDGSDHVCVVLTPLSAAGAAPFAPLRLSMVTDVEPGHAAEERPRPADERAP